MYGELPEPAGAGVSSAGPEGVCSLWVPETFSETETWHELPGVYYNRNMGTHVFGSIMVSVPPTTAIALCWDLSFHVA